MNLNLVIGEDIELQFKSESTIPKEWKRVHITGSFKQSSIWKIFKMDGWMNEMSTVKSVFSSYISSHFKAAVRNFWRSSG